MARKKTAAPKHIEPEDENRDAEQERLEATAPDKPMSKASAIRAALAEGHDSPGAGTAFIKKRFGIEIAKQHFSAAKSQMKSREDAKKGSPGTAAAKTKPQPVEGHLAPPEQPAGQDGNLLDALEQMKPLIAQYGVDGVKRMVDLLG
jgi:hypothetical protein